MPASKVSILVVDDDVRILRMMQRILELEGYRTITASNGEAALQAFEAENPGLVLLDIMMPGLDGHAVCQRIREFSTIPIIMVTAKGNDEEKVKGLDAGADDYVTKPFSAQELAARVRAVLRRTKLSDDKSEPAFRCHDLVIEFARHQAMLADKPLNLTATEFKLLSYIARNAGRVLTPDQILVKVWGEEYTGESHLLQVTMARLRQKLGDGARNPKYILTRPGIGYTMMKESQASPPPTTQ